MHAGALRSRLTAIGLSLNHFIRLAGIDSRNARRQESGRTPVTAGTVRALEEAEQLADELMGKYRAEGLAVVPRWDKNEWPEGEPFPPSFYLVCAGRVAREGVEVMYVDEADDVVS